MIMKLICGCLLALLGCLADAQYLSQQAQQQQWSQQHQQSQQNQQVQASHTVSQHESKPKIPSKFPKTEEIFHSCEVDSHYRVRCGVPDISAEGCQAINCCFDGQMCYFAKSVTLQCTPDAQVILVVSREATLPNLDLETISFLGTGENCGPVATSSIFAIYQFPVTACGTVMTEEPGFIYYENRMTSSYEVSIGPKGIITRDSSYELMFQCRYSGTSYEALIIEVGVPPPPYPVAAVGPLSVGLFLGSGICDIKGCVEEDVAYNTYYMENDYPITKVLRDPVYVEVRILGRTDPDIGLTLGRCWTTSSPYPHSLPQWDLLINGCPNQEDRYLTTLSQVIAIPEKVEYPQHYRRFIFKMFTFAAAGLSDAGTGVKKGAADSSAYGPLKENVYIHCDATVCKGALTRDCQQPCFRKKRDVAAYFHKSREDSALVSSGKIIIVDPTWSAQ